MPKLTCYFSCQFFSLFYRKSDDFSSSPEQIYGDGDGTVNRRSLEGCMHWASQQNQTIVMKAISGADHMGILGHKDVIAYVVDLLGQS
jgi:lysophospholipase III